MAAQVYRRPNQPLSAALQAQMYYARKRRKERAEATSSDGGFRAQKAGVGIAVVVILTTQ